MARKNLVLDSPSNKLLLWQGAAFVGLFAVLVLWQGGYYAAPTCAIGILAAGCGVASTIVSVRARRADGGSCAGCASGANGGGFAIPLLLAGVGVCSLISSAVHGLTLTNLADSAPWFAVAALIFLYVLVPVDQREKTMRAATWFGVGSSVLGLALMSGLDAAEGVFNAGRLQFPFQYANTSGVWYATGAVLTLGSENKRLRRMTVFPLAALLFTQSAGACVLFAGVFVVLCICWLRSAAFERVAEATLLAACAAGAFVFCYVVGSTWAFACVVSAFGISLLSIYTLGKVGSAKSAAVAACILLAVCVFICAGVLVQTGRAAQAGQTFIERLIQMKDAGAVVVANPVFGIGPDAWRFLYPYVQSAQYTATSVHGGYLQIALDVGLIGVLLFITAIVSGIRRAISCRNVSIACAILMIAVHAAFDIDFQFSALLGLLAMLLIGCAAPASSGVREPREISTAWRTTLAVGFLAATLMVSACGLWAASVKNECASAVRDEDFNAIRQVIERNSFAANDNSVLSYYGESLWRAGAWSGLVSVFGEEAIPSADLSLFLAEAFYALGEDGRAENVLLTELEREPGNINLFARARLLLATHDPSNEAQERYRLAAARANAMASTGLASLLRNQECFSEVLSDVNG